MMWTMCSHYSVKTSNRFQNRQTLWFQKAGGFYGYADFPQKGTQFGWTSNVPCSLVSFGGCEQLAIVDVNKLPPGMLTKRRGHLVTFNRWCDRVAIIVVKALPPLNIRYHNLQQTDHPGVYSSLKALHCLTLSLQCCEIIHPGIFRNLLLFYYGL